MTGGLVGAWRQLGGILSDPDLPPAAASVAFWALDYDGERDICLSLGTFEKLTGMNRKTVRRAVTALVDRGYFLVVDPGGRGAGHTRRMAPVYAAGERGFMLAKERAKPAPEPTPERDRPDLRVVEPAEPIRGASAPPLEEGIRGVTTPPIEGNKGGQRVPEGGSPCPIRGVAMGPNPTCKNPPEANPPELRLSSSGDDAGDVADAMLAIFHDELSEVLPKVRDFHQRRRKKAAARFKDCCGESLEAWRHACQQVRASDFLLGGGSKGWRADFDWMLGKDKHGNWNLLNLAEGKYSGGQGGARASGGGTGRSRGAIMNDIFNRLDQQRG